MIRFSLLLALVAFLVPATALPQCDFRSTYSENFRTTALDVSFENNELWVATGFGVALYDRSGEAAVPLASIGLPGITTEALPSGDLVYAGAGTTLHIVRRVGTSLQRVRSIELGATVNDLLVVGTFLYAATSTGVIQFDLVSRENPAIANHLPTTSGRAFSLATSGALLYAADGDGSIEIYSIQVPSIAQKIGVAAASGQPVSLLVSGERLYASDATEIEVFSTGSTPARIGLMDAFGGGAFAPFGGNIVFTAGADRRIRATDLSQPSAPVVLYDTELPASSGTVNRVDALAVADGRIYAAAGDLGLLTFDARGFTPPYPLRHLVTSPARSVVSLESSVIVGGESAGLRQYSQNPSEALTLARTWDNSRTSVVFDASATRLLTAVGPTLVLWDLSPPIPASLSSATLPQAVTSAVLLSQTGYAILSDRSLWRVDLSQAAPTPTRVNISGSPSFIARAGSALALADINEDGTTTLRYFASGDLGSPPLTASISGAATSGIALSDNGLVVAVTFSGLNVVDFRSGTPGTFVLQGSGAVPARDLGVVGNDLVVSNSSILEVWDLQSRTLRQRFSIPASINGVSISPAATRLITLATSTGVTTVNYLTSSTLPELETVPSTNRFYSSLFQSTDRIHLSDAGVLDSFRLDVNGRPTVPRSVLIPGGTIESAVIGEIAYTVNSVGRVIGRDINSGNQVTDFQINEGSDATALAMNAVGQALYLSISRGCLTGGCEKKTLILQQAGSSLLQITSLSGALLDFVVSGQRLYGLFDDPDEIRVIDIANPQAPSTISARPTEGNPVSIAYSANRQTVYTLGQRVYVYTESGLTKVGELLEPYVSDPTGTLNYLEQSLAIVENCAVIGGRTLKPQVYSITSPSGWTAVSTPEVSGVVQKVVARGQNVYLLTDYSLEIWSSNPLVIPRRHIRR